MNEIIGLNSKYAIEDQDTLLPFTLGDEIG